MSTPMFMMILTVNIHFYHANTCKIDHYYIYNYHRSFCTIISRRIRQNFRNILANFGDVYDLDSIIIFG